MHVIGGKLQLFFFFSCRQKPERNWRCFLKLPSTASSRVKNCFSFSLLLHSLKSSRRHASSTVVPLLRAYCQISATCCMVLPRRSGGGTAESRVYHINLLLFEKNKENTDTGGVIESAQKTFTEPFVTLLNCHLKVIAGFPVILAWHCW